MTIRSDKFDDVYFSAEDGMAETQHVFLQGNDLPQRWAGYEGSHFTIAETGFGTGLNFLCAWKLFEDNAPDHIRLHFISVEKYPLSRCEIRNALDGWNDDLGDYIDRYLDLYPIRVPGPHVIHVTDRVTLTVWFGDIAKILPEWRGFQVDSWFLDGFTPAKNPDMWGDDLYSHMARLSNTDTTLATFTAAGHVRRGLEAAGFEIEKSPGFGRKREMVRGYFKCKQTKTLPLLKANSKTIAIIGGGLAGCAMAYLAKRRGLNPIIYEAGESVAVGASGGELGMVNPKLSAIRTPQSDYYTSAYAYTLRILSTIDDVDFQICGSRYVCFDADKDRRFTGYIKNLGWHGDHITRDEDNKDIIYPDGACVSPKKLCSALVDGVDVRLNHPVNSLNDIGAADYIVLANGHGVNNLLNVPIPIHPVRGQVSWIRPQAGIKSNIVSGAYITPQTSRGFHVVGATIDPNRLDTDVMDDSHNDNIRRYNEVDGYDLYKDDIIGGWAAIRTSSKDRYPMVGKIDERTYVSTAHGSHGIISSFMSAEIILSLILRQPIPASKDVLKALSPDRFFK